MFGIPEFKYIHMLDIDTKHTCLYINMNLITKPQDSGIQEKEPQKQWHDEELNCKRLGHWQI